VHFRIEAPVKNNSTEFANADKGVTRMKRNGAFAAALVCSLILVVACQPAGVETNRSAVATTPTPEVVNTAAIETELLRIENDWPRIIREKDVAAVGRIMADDIILIYPDGNVGNKEQELKDIGAGALTAESIEMADLKVHVIDNDAAYVTGRTVLNRAKYQPTTEVALEISGHYRFLDTFARRNGEWKLVAGASVPLRQPPTASPSPTVSVSPASSPATRPSPASTRSPGASPAATP
jgi:ketosteroid isomerase-like protein